jgi:hypothetical protein
MHVIQILPAVLGLLLTGNLLSPGAETSPPRPGPSGAAVSPARTRLFHMGFTAFPHDLTADAIKQAREFVRTNADLIAHHIEGVPWAEALRNEPFPKELMADRETKRSMTPPGAKSS